jgi:Lrp/AsnC family transcriptional regulator for asnA, asnC and gidA
MFKLDQLNRRIISHLQEGRKSFKRIADSLGISENTVKARVRKLESEGIFRIAGYVAAAELDGHQIVYIGIKLNSMNYVEKGRELSELQRVVSVGVVTGRYDLILTVHLKSGFGLLEFLSDELGKVEGIRAAETFVVYKGFNIKLPYIADDWDDV